MSTTIEYKCPNCGAPIIFSGATQNFECEYCSTTFSREQVELYNQVQQQGENGQSNNASWNISSQQNEYLNTMGYICTSCGAEINCDENTAATECIYCGNPVILTRNVSGMLKPDFIIPFKKTKEEAKQALRNFYKGKKLLPKVFKDENHIDKITGLYVPFWLFNCVASGVANFNATKVRRWTQGDYRYKETSHFVVTRSGSAVFQKVPVDGSKKMADDYMDSIEPFDYKDMVNFNDAYLSGFLADKYDVSAEETESRAILRIENSLVSDLRSTVTGYDSVTLSSSHISTSDNSADYALLPVWILNTNYKGQTYMFAMNGQTGKIVGKLPIDKGRFCRWLFGLTGLFSVIGVILCIILYYLY